MGIMAGPIIEASLRHAISAGNSEPIGQIAGVTADIADAAAPVPRLAQLVADRVGRGIISESLPKPGSSGIEIGEFQAMAVDWKGIDLQGPDGIIVAVAIARTVEDTAFLARDIAKLDEAVCEQPVLDDRAASLGDRAEAVALVGTVAVAIGVRRGRGQSIGFPVQIDRKSTRLNSSN